MTNKRTASIVILCLSALALLPAGSAWAHAALKASLPQQGESVRQAPKSVHLQFTHPARLVKFSLRRSGAEIPLKLETTAAAASEYDIPLPVLLPGKYQVRWGTLGSDGHPMTGTLNFNIIGK